MFTASMRKYQKVLWIIISVVVILSFVVYFSPQAKLQGGGEEVALGTIDGRPISRQEYQNARQETLIRYRLYNGRWPGSDAMSRQMFDEENETASRLLLIAKLKEYQVHVGPEVMAEWIASTFKERGKAFNPAQFEQFMTREMIPNGVTDADFQRFVTHEVGVQHLAGLVGVPGKLVNPREAESLYRRQNEQLVTEGAFFLSTNYLSSVAVTPAAISQYYSNNLGHFRINERVQVSYVQFYASNFLNEASKLINADPNFLATVDKVYLQRGTNYYVDEKGVPNTELAAKEKIKAEVQQQAAVNLARKQANEFVEALSEQGMALENFAKVAAAKGIPIKVSAPLDLEQTQVMSDAEEFAPAAGKLTPEEPFSAAIPGKDSAYVLALKQRYPSEIQPFAQVQDKATKEYRESEALKAARKAGNDFRVSLTNALAKGKTFAEAAADAKVTLFQVPPFARSTRALPEVEDKASLSQIKNEAFNLTPGKPGNFSTTAQGGFILNLKTKLAVDETKLAAELPEFVKNLRRSQQYESFSEWFRKERDKVNLAVGKKRGAAN